MQVIRERKIYKYILMVMIFFLWAFLSGCGEADEPEKKDDTVVFTFGGVNVSVAETSKKIRAAFRRGCMADEGGKRK